MEVEIERVVLVRSVADPRTEEHTAVRQLVDGGDLLGHVERMIEREQRDARPETQRLGARRDRSERDPGVQREPGGEPVVAEDDEVVPELLDASAVLEHVVIRMAGVGRGDDRDVHTELHVSPWFHRVLRCTW